VPGVRKRGEEIRDFIVLNITDNKNIASLTSRQFGITLPAVYKHIDRLVSEGRLTKKNKRYVLRSKQFKYEYINNKKLTEDSVWENDIKKHFATAPKNVLQIWVYGFLEIFNNAIEHSDGKNIRVIINQNRIFTDMSIIDDGIGIFNNIMAKFNLAEEKDALLELSKGKRTTDKKRHSGQGIFFTSKIFDIFKIISNDIIFGSETENKKLSKTKFSTLVYMFLPNNSDKIIKDIFNEYSTEIPGDFDKTIVPIRMANSSDLVSRSQARRVLSGLELFREVTLDFDGIEYIGQAFADEIFRVFTKLNPETAITAQNANEDVQSMINRAVNTKL
jgi:anti-sigma regulatory factor (Ser/Thr protein kinase)